jgi:hypothetical protein
MSTKALPNSIRRSVQEGKVLRVIARDEFVDKINLNNKVKINCFIKL